MILTETAKPRFSLQAQAITLQADKAVEKLNQPFASNSVTQTRDQLKL